MGRRVFIKWVNPLFHDTLRALLGHPEVEIVGNSADYEAALASIEELQPDTVIVEETEDTAQNVATLILQVFESRSWCPRVMRMSLQDNDLWVYHREQWTVNDRDELIQIIGG